MGKCSQAEAAVNVDARCCAVGVGNSNPPAQAPVSKHATSSGSLYQRLRGLYLNMKSSV